MPHLDRQLKPITQQEWRERLSGRRTGLIRAGHPGPGRMVEAFWLGWVSSAESPPRPFGVREGAEDADRHDWHTYHWCATEAEALALHGRLMSAGAA